MCWINIQSSQPRSFCCNHPHFFWDFEWFCNRCTHFWHINRFHIQIHWFVTGNNFNHHLFPSMDSRPSFPHPGLPTPSASLGPIWDMCAWNRWHWAILILGLSDKIAMSLEIYGTPKAMGNLRRCGWLLLKFTPPFKRVWQPKVSMSNQCFIQKCPKESSKYVAAAGALFFANKAITFKQHEGFEGCGTVEVLSDHKWTVPHVVKILYVNARHHLCLCLRFVNRSLAALPLGCIAAEFYAQSNLLQTIRSLLGTAGAECPEG